VSVALGTVLMAVALLAGQHPSHDIRGIVVDLTGAAVPAAEVSAEGSQAVTDSSGRFVLAVSADSVTLRARAAGFEDHERRLTLPSRPVRVVLRPAGLSETLTVTAGRTTSRLADTASAASVVTAATLLTAGSLMLDDSLRTIPGFSLFRRSSSRVANPTTQGAGIRGLAASGASRALVLADGVPLNDPFGGWVYWNRVPIMAIDRVEVVRGGASGELYGHEAVAGVIQVFATEPERRSLRAMIEGGSHGYARGSIFGGGQTSGWRGFGAGERAVFDGFPIVAADSRGLVDTPAGVRYWSTLGDLTRQSTHWWTGLRGGWLDEDRANGTPLQRNDTTLRHLALRGGAMPGRGAVTFSASAGDVQYHQSFSAVLAGRSAEALTSRQRVTSDHRGVSLQWTGLLGPGALLIGGDARRTSGASDETRYGAGLPIAQGVSGGHQRDYAAFAQITAQPATRLTLTAGARAGVWSTGRTDPQAGRPRWLFLMPRVAAAWSATDALLVHASWSNPGRTPTLNELYRDFRVGNTVTSANPGLSPESAQTVEGGVLWRHRRASARGVAFWTDLDDAVTNVTLFSGPAGILRQRRNAGTIRARGLEVEGDWRVTPYLSFTGSAAVLDSRFRRSDEPGLAGNRVPQVPRWQASIGARAVCGANLVTLEWRGVGPQFDDDRNAFRLAPGSVIDLYAARSLRRVQPFVAIENLFDAEIDVGRTPVRTVGTPRSIRVGLRVLFP
jgi:outer membrane receptor protein involved in Fe transport